MQYIKILLALIEKYLNLNYCKSYPLEQYRNIQCRSSEASTADQQAEIDHRQLLNMPPWDSNPDISQ